uniref:AB hydrolase-1 domain-containing protein n=1 Tax=Aegilops tauschii subsp. strangulata TaxID=200361 RepID=A0A453PDH7_AEGTS
TTPRCRPRPRPRRHAPARPSSPDIKIMLIWGDEDKLFDIELAKKMNEQLGENCYLQGIPKAGHLLHLERPCAYNRQLGRFLAYVNSQENQTTS